jgi:hypothetical protein
MKDEALRLALEDLEHFEIAGLATLRTIDAIIAIKKVLAQPEPEPVEYWTVADGWVSEQAEVPTAVWVEPDFWEHCNRVNCGTAYRLPAPGRQPLYTTPQSAVPERKPLTDEEIEALRRSDDLFEDAPMWRLIARAIEAAHGIKG